MIKTINISLFKTELYTTIARRANNIFSNLPLTIDITSFFLLCIISFSFFGNDLYTFLQIIYLDQIIYGSEVIPFSFLKNDLYSFLYNTYFDQVIAESEQPLSTISVWIILIKKNKKIND